MDSAPSVLLAARRFISTEPSPPCTLPPLSMSKSFKSFSFPVCVDESCERFEPSSGSRSVGKCPTDECRSPPRVPGPRFLTSNTAMTTTLDTTARHMGAKRNESFGASMRP